MSFFEEQKVILQSCAYLSATFIAPGLGILYRDNQDITKKVTLGSVGFFASCIIKNEFNYMFENNHAAIITGATVGGIAYAHINNYNTYHPSILMSLGYTGTNLIPYALIIPATIGIEIYTELLSGGKLSAGLESGIVFSAMTIAHDICNAIYTDSQKPMGLYEQQDQCPAA